MRFWVIISIMLCATPAAAQVAGEGATDILRYYGERAAHIQLVGEMHNGEIEVASQGSGFLLDDRHVLTNNHVLPDVAHNYRKFTTNVRLGSRRRDPVAAKVVARDAANDLALLELERPPTPAPYCPVSALMPPATLAPGSWLYVVGFPLNRDRRVAPGLLGNPDDGELLQTDAPLNTGNSGGPVFSSKGYLFAVAARGVVELEHPDGTVEEVDGINDLIPISRLTGSPVGAWLDQHSTGRCWRATTSMPNPEQFAWTDSPGPVDILAAASSAGALGLEGTLTSASSAEAANGITRAPAGTQGTALSATPPLPPSLTIEFGMSETKDDHGLTVSVRQYQKSFSAQPGYLIDECEISIASANRESGVECVISPDHDHATLRFSLSSGPAYDRWRGWLTAMVSLTQQRADRVDASRLPEKKSVRLPLSYVQNEHALFAVTRRTYERVIPAAAGFVITDCALEAISVNKSKDIKCSLDPSGRLARFSFELKSGPTHDRWRGWLKGDLVVTMAKAAQ